jgi:multidrug efflux pump subunit AcrA (membrane-fusion protein)
VSETISRDEQDPDAQQDSAGHAGVPSGQQSGRWHRRGGWAVLGVVVVAAGAVSAWRAGVFSPASPSGSGQQGAPAPATAAVTRQDVSATTPVSGTLGYAGSYPVTGLGSGSVTWLPSAGQVITQGHKLYTTNLTSPVVLLYGRVPGWRTLDEGVTGADVRQLNHDLVTLGDATSTDISALGWDYFSWATKAGVRKLQSHLGISSPSGSLTKGQVVFKPEALRVSQATATLGGSASGPVLQATSARHQVTVPLDAAQQSEVKAGDQVTVTLPDGTTTPGVVASVGKVAVRSGSGQGATTTIPVAVRLTHPKAAGSLDQAPVTVNITTATAHNALVVPIGALLAQPGGYAVEVIGQANTRRYITVRVGPVFDDTGGLVQVAGDLTPGQRVVVPAS